MSVTCAVQIQFSRIALRQNVVLAFPKPYTRLVGAKSRACKANPRLIHACSGNKASDT